MEIGQHGLPKRAWARQDQVIAGFPVHTPENTPPVVLDELQKDLQTLPAGVRKLLGHAGYQLEILPKGQPIPGAEDALGYTDGEKRLVQLREEGLTPGVLGNYRLGLHELGHAFDQSVLDLTLMGNLLGPAGAALSRAHFEFTKMNFAEASERPFQDGLGRPGSVPIGDQCGHGPIFLNQYSSTARAEHVAECFESDLTGQPGQLQTKQDHFIEAAINRSREDLQRSNGPMLAHLEGLFATLETLPAPDH